MKKLDIVKEKVTPHFTTAEKNKKELHNRQDRLLAGKKVPKYIKIHEMAPVDELISFAQYFEMTQFDGDPRMWKDPMRRNDPDSPGGTVTGTQTSEDHLRTSDTAGNGDAGVTGSLTPPFDSDTNMPANIARSPGGYSKDINTPGIPMTMGESPIKQFIHGKFQEPAPLKAKYARPKPKLKEERPILDLMKRELIIPKKKGK